MKAGVVKIIKDAIGGARLDGVINGEKLPEIVLDKPKKEEFGDFSTNIAMLLAPVEKKAPRDIAKAIADRISASPDIEKCEVAGPGFINIFLKKSFWLGILEDIIKSGAGYGQSEIGRGQKVQVEFVSANPTGPLHVGHGRGAAVGDALSNILKFAGYQVSKEYYINDAGRQVLTLGESVRLRIEELNGKAIEFPQDFYKGEYIKDIAADYIEKYGAIDAPGAPSLKDFGSQSMLERIKSDLLDFGIEFDNWFSERSLDDTGMVAATIEELKSKGHVFESEGALWFRTTEFGDDKDRVLIKADGERTYFASDIAYHNDKFARKFNWVIDILGPDHHGYVSRTKAALQALGYDSNQLTVLISQQVNLLQNEVLVKMSKRAGKLITMDDLMKEVGKDVARYFFLMRSTSSHLDFDLELAKKETPENPVFYIQYAHARIASIFRKALQTKIKADFKKVALELLNLPEEGEIAKHLLEFPNVLAKTAKELEPHHLAFYVLELAKQFQSYYSQAKHDPRYKVVDLGNFETTNAKLYLLKNIQIVLQNALGILGVSAPQRMKKEDAASTL